jgi:alpha-galactosidase
MRKKIVFFLLSIACIIHAQEINFKVTPNSALKGIEKKQIENNVCVYTFNFAVDSLKQGIDIEWEKPVNNMHSFWSPKGIGWVRANWSSRVLSSYATSDAPVISYMDNTDNNKFTFALSDALNSINISSGVVEETAMLKTIVNITPETFWGKKTYSISLRVDKRNIPYWKSLQETSDWWAKFNNYKALDVPEVAKRPMYSTWYSFHQLLDTKTVIENCRIAKKSGCEAVIVDDGWQTLDNNRGYRFTGDWKSERIPNMKAFADSIHQLGMKIMVWYSVPFVGDKSEAYKQFDGKFLSYQDRRGVGVLDPRYPDVREYLIDTYVKALKNWGIDGFKLDFVDNFKANNNDDYKPGMDFRNVYEATDKMLMDITAALKSVNNNILIEFRQSYVGPLMRKYGNMFRASDCPYSANENRIKTTNVRLLAGSTATHADMIMWHPEESAEVAALQLLNVMFAVPQISVRLDNYPQRHNDMLKFWLGFWNRNRDALVNGKFEAHSPIFNYPLLVSKTDRKMVAGVYLSNTVVDINNDSDNFSEIFVINATGNKKIIVNSKKAATYIYKTYDCIGNVLSKNNIKLIGIHEFNVPESGLLELKLQ